MGMKIKNNEKNVSIAITFLGKSQIERINVGNFIFRTFHVRVILNLDFLFLNKIDKIFILNLLYLPQMINYRHPSKLLTYFSVSDQQFIDFIL